MCGIAGYIAPRGRVPEEALASLVRRLRHRGPDDSGHVRLAGGDAECGLASTRLSILDLSPSGRMPMEDPASGNCITYNGECYNFGSIREELVRKGETFRSGTDTEVVLTLYRREGPGALDRLRGMFALAIWDAVRRELFLARDRVGKKPLYFAQPLPGVFVFASEVRALLAAGLVNGRLDPLAVADYLCNGFVVSPRTILQDVRGLLPGHWMRVTTEGRIAEVDRYWRLPAARREAAGWTVEAQTESLRESFREAVALRLVSDVPVGVFLSGGMDSTAIAAAVRSKGGDLRTFNVRLEDPVLDESARARATARSIGSHHTEVALTGASFREWLPGALESMDQPTFDGINTYMVARAVREEGLKVAVSGLGADEIFGGYPFFGQIPGLHRAARIARLIPGPVRGALRRHIAHHRGLAHLSGLSKALDLVFRPDRPGSEGAALRSAYQTAQTLFPSWAREALHPGFAGPGARGGDHLAMGLPPEFVRFLEEELDPGDPAGHVSRIAWRLFLGERCLRDTDTMSMGVSLEVRAPFTDHVLVEEMMAVPTRIRCAGPPEKPFERSLLGPIIGRDWTPRPKQGFILPFERWMGEGPVRGLVAGLLSDGSAMRSAGLNSPAAAEVWARHEADPRAVPWSRPWALFVLADWCRRSGASV